MEVEDKSGHVISMSEYQNKELRSLVTALQTKVAAYERYAKNSQTINERVHALVLKLLAAKTYAEVARTVREHVGQAFLAPYFVAMYVWGLPLGVPNGDGESEPVVSEQLIGFVTDLTEPYRGPGESYFAAELFGERGEQVRSFALLPLYQEREIFGVLALGSQLDDSFTPDMDTLFLRQIAEMVATALLRASA